jgi:hypothetical protein
LASEIEAGTATIDGIAKREACSKRRVHMTISLAFLASSLVKAAIVAQDCVAVNSPLQDDCPQNPHWRVTREVVLLFFSVFQFHRGPSQGASMSITKWSAEFNADKTHATLKVSHAGQNAVPIRLKGICYSPVPIGASFDYAPNIGDFFWDSFKVDNFHVNGWLQLWGRDLQKLRDLGINCIRIYSCLSHHLKDNGDIPDPDSSDFKGRWRTHQSFLDQCWNHGDRPIHVLVGLPVPEEMFWKERYNNSENAAKIKFWRFVYKETARQLGSHQTVMGFTLFNELADGEHSYNNADKAEFFWTQVQTLAEQVKTVAPDKLVGIGLHDDPQYTGSKCTNYLAKLTKVDFYGVNTYQHETVVPVFGPVPNVGVGYGNLPLNARKPIIITEWGMPGTTRPNIAGGGPWTIFDDSQSRGKAATVITSMVPKFFAEKLCLGLFYFEYCDEWWKQKISYADIVSFTKNPQYGGWINKIPEELRINDKLFPAIYKHWGGVSVGASFPNGYQDEAGFGLYAVDRAPGVPMINQPYGPASGNEIRPAKIDIFRERTEMTKALKDCYANVK